MRCSYVNDLSAQVDICTRRGGESRERRRKIHFVLIRFSAKGKIISFPIACYNAKIHREREKKSCDFSVKLIMLQGFQFE